MKVIIISLFFFSLIAIAHTDEVISDSFSDEVLDEQLAKLNLTYYQPWAPIRFIAGFYHGLHLFDNITEAKECCQMYQDIVPDVQDIISIIQKMEMNENIYEQMKRILDRLEHMHYIISKKTGTCHRACREMRKICMDLKKFLAKDPRRMQKSILHMIENIESLRKYVMSIQEHMKNGKWGWAGKSTGEFLRFMMFWDYTPPMLCFLGE